MSSNMLPNTGYQLAMDVDRNKHAVSDNSSMVKTVESVNPSNITKDINAIHNPGAIAPMSEESVVVNEKSAKIDDEQLDAAIEIVSSFINQPPRNVNFNKDESSGKTVIKVFDLDSKELIKQFPSEELLSIAQKIKALQEEVSVSAGILLDEKV